MGNEEAGGNKVKVENPEPLDFFIILFKVINNPVKLAIDLLKVVLCVLGGVFGVWNKRSFLIQDKDRIEIMFFDAIDFILALSLVLLIQTVEFPI